jgi:LmbE family N-acetylglucosaminyl deacetylase
MRRSKHSRQGVFSHQGLRKASAADPVNTGLAGSTGMADHRAASEIALAATRKIPRVLLTQVSWNSTPQVFNPRYFVDITKQFEVKREAIRCYEDEYERTGHLWEKFIQAQGQLFGLQAGCEMAEGFEVVKFLY